MNKNLTHRSKTLDLHSFSPVFFRISEVVMHNCVSCETTHKNYSKYQDAEFQKRYRWHADFEYEVSVNQFPML
jgi:hypothetical protein